MLFFTNKHLQSSLTDGSHRVVWHSRDEQGEQLVWTSLEVRLQVWNMCSYEIYEMGRVHNAHVENMVVDVNVRRWENLSSFCMKGKPEGRGTCGTQSRKRPEIFIFRDCIGVQFLDCRYLTFSPSIHCIGLCFKVQKMLPLRLGASSLRVDYDRASRCLQPGFNSNLRKFSFKLRLCSFVYDRLTPAMRGDGDIFVFVFCIWSSHLSNMGRWRGRGRKNCSNNCSVECARYVQLSGQARERRT